MFRIRTLLASVSLLVLLGTAGCSERNPKVVEIGPSYLGYLLLTDVPVPSDPEAARDLEFSYVGQVPDGTRCAVLGKAEGWHETILEVACAGITSAGWIPLNAVTVIEYSD